MNCLFLLSGENIELAKEEILSLIDCKKFKLTDNILIADGNFDIRELSERLAYCHAIYQLLFVSDERGLVRDVKNFDWNKIYKKDFCVRFRKAKEKTMAGYIWDKLKAPKVNLTNPKTLIQFFQKKDDIYCTLLLKKIKKDFAKRKAHLRPELHPTSLHPKLARALVNLSGASRGEVVLDPFCGAGGILIEGALIGVKVVGGDLYEVMLRKAKRNLEYYKIKGYRLVNEDALKINKRYDYVVSDLPYGMNTAVWIKGRRGNKKIILDKSNRKLLLRNLGDFYLKFMKNLHKIVGRRAVIIFPHYVDYKGIIRKAGFKIEKEFSQFIHGSLTRKIVVLGL